MSGRETLSARARRRIGDLWYRTPFWEWAMCPPWGFVDGVGHALHLPERAQRHLCRRFDLALGCPDTSANFPWRREEADWWTE